MRVSEHERLVAIVGDHFGLYGYVLAPSQSLRQDLGADEIDVQELLITVEETFGVELISEAAALDTIEALVKAVQSQRKANK